MIEVEFRRLVILALPREIKGLRVWAQNTGKIVIPGANRRVFSAGVPKGAADVSGILSPDGIRLELELKSRTARLTPEQKLFGEAILKLGGIYAMYRMQSDDAAKELPGCVATVRNAIAARRARLVEQGES